ncbi:MAG: hypothetical protein Q7S09_05460 [bacterium]|nr:hypothetical protein [bacterium]
MEGKEMRKSEKQETVTTPESKELFKTECLVIPGHGIEFVGEEGNGKWKPTRLVQGIDDKGWRTGKRNPGLDDEKAIVGGGNAVVLAGAQYFRDLEKSGSLPRLVIFAAGRAGYLEKSAPDDPLLCEGVPMMESFEKETSATELIGKDGVVIISGTKTTRDDVERSIELAVSKGLTKIAFLLLELRLERASVFWEIMKKERPELASLDVRFLAAEDFLKERYKNHPELVDKILSEFKSSKAFGKTDEAEKGGAQAAREGKYTGKGKY